MSFILDALKKLEREKQAREPGVVMVGPVPWGGRDRRRWARTLGLAAAALGVVVMGALWWLQAEPAPPRPVDRDAAAGQASEPSPAVASAPAATTLPPAGEAVVARPSASRDRRATTAAAPAPARRERDLPPAPPAPTPATPSQATAPEEIAPAVVETAPEPPIEPAPAEEGAAADPEFRLTAISTRDGEPIALLNDRLVREGDSFGGVRVLRIGATDVEIEVDGQRRTIGF